METKEEIEVRARGKMRVRIKIWDRIDRRQRGNKNMDKNDIIENMRGRDYDEKKRNGFLIKVEIRLRMQIRMKMTILIRMKPKF